MKVSEEPAEGGFTILTTISVTCNEAATRRYREYEKQGLDWIGRMIITENLVELAAKNNIQVRIEDARPQIVKLALQDNRSDMVYYVIIRFYFFPCDSRNRFRSGLYAAARLDKVSVRGLPDGSVRVTKVGEWAKIGA